jgi:hypothetical protein
MMQILTPPLKGLLLPKCATPGSRVLLQTGFMCTTQFTTSFAADWWSDSLI